MDPLIKSQRLISLVLVRGGLIRLDFVTEQSIAMSPRFGFESQGLNSHSGALHNLCILSRRGDAGCAVVVFFCNPAIDMLQDATGEIRIVTCVRVDRGGGASPEKMRADRDAESQARGLG